MLEKEYKKPILIMEFTNSFGDHVKVELDVEDETFDSLMDAVKQCVAGFGYSEKLINEYWA